MPKTIVIFDVDYTLSEGFIEEALFTAMDPQIKSHQYRKGFRGEESWSTIITRALKNFPPTISQLQNHLSGVPMVAGMRNAFQQLRALPDTTLAILSGGNNLLVEKYLQVHQCSEFFEHIYATHLTYSQENNTYNYKPVNQKCHLPTCSICKAKIHDFMKIVKEFDRIIYVGDGLNDICGMSMIQNGIAFVRKDGELHKKSKKNQEIMSAINAPYSLWTDGFDLAHQLRTLF